MQRAPEISDTGVASAVMAGVVLMPITAVERETGISKELLRMWERRYGFPIPLRDAQGDRIYPPDQVEKLCLLRRLIDAGFRPGKIIALEKPELEKLLSERAPYRNDSTAIDESELLDVLKSNDPDGIHNYLQHQIIKLGLQNFVIGFLPAANSVVGNAWMRGDLEVFEEHLYTEQLQSLIRTAISGLRSDHQAPNILITTPPEELHQLGMLMVEALMRLENANAISFGSQMPVREVAKAVYRHNIHIVALSFSASYPTNKAIEYLEELRLRLPLNIEIWAGGASLSSTRKRVAEVMFFSDLKQIKPAIQEWREMGV